jgi:PEGA domain-containing protein
MAGIGATRVFQPEPRRDTNTQDADPFLAFNSESAEAVAPAPAPFVPPAVETPFQPVIRPPLKVEPYKLEQPANLAPITIGLCIGLAGIATAGVLYFQLGRQQAAATRPAARAAGVVQTHGTLTVDSRPGGATVRVNGTLQGATPLSVTLPIGNHEIELQNGEARRKLPLTIAGGETVSQIIDLQPVQTGFVTFRSPLTMRVSEGGRALGVTSGKLALAAGRHDLELASTTLDYRTRMTVYITPGQTASVSVDVPQGSVSINAIPWANVWLDGRPLGITPLANLKVAIGSHEIVWRHPTLGERKRTVQVTARAPVRVGMDFSQ